MSSSKEKIKRNVSQLILYGIIGGISASIDFVAFYVLAVKLGMYYIAANCVSVLGGIITSFTLNRSLNFKVTDKAIVRFGLFFTCGMFGLALSNFILWVGVKCCFTETNAKVVSIFIVAFLQFIFNKFVTFRKVG